MRSSKATLLMIGSLPPPAIGPSIAMQRLLEGENLRNAFDLILLNISDRRAPDNVGKFDVINAWLAAKHIIQCLMLVVLRQPAIVYLNISQSFWGYVRDLGFIVPALLLRRKVVVHLRGSEFGLFYATMPGISRWFTRAVFKRVSRVIVLGHILKQVFKGLVQEDRIAVVPNGINYLEYGSVQERVISKNGGTVLYLSSLRKRKGLFQMIEALPNILIHHPEVHVKCAGEWQDNEEKRHALTRIQATGLSEHVTFIGEVTGAEKIELYKQHDVFVFTPIEPEGLPWVILEAMSAGLPVVTSGQGAIAEVVKDGETGYLIDPEPAQIAAKVCYLLENPVEAKAMGLKGRRRIEQYFSESAYLKSMEQVFKDALLA